MADQELPPQGPPAPPPSGGNLPLGGGAGNGGNQNLVPTNIEDEMKRSYLDYAMSVIVGRALPDIMRFASATAALKCTRFGGASGSPKRACKKSWSMSAS